ncbi:MULTISPECIES: AAA family ATPase [Bosea]|uniref:AAA family ATPase n=1 Tax=Bosea TaxID=85413 RepID=UPI00286D39C3|nr:MULTISPECIES: AAA family ATPase [Bosea]
MPSYQPLLSETMRPQTISDLTLPAPLLAKLQGMVGAKSVLNMVFHGAPGTGKTSAARIMAATLNADMHDLNGALNRGIASAMADLEKWASGASLMIDEPKICIIDEADQLNKKMQTALSYIIENCFRKTRFILTTNNLERLCAPLRSRCEPFCFDVRPCDRLEIIDLMSRRYHGYLEGSGYSISKWRCDEIVRIYFPDLRRVANQFQLELAA